MDDLLQHLRILDSVDGNGRKMEGWCSYEKALAMAELVIATKPKICVELGVFGGRSLVALGIGMQRAQSGVVYGVDPWTKEAVTDGHMSDADRKWWSELDLAGIYASCVEAIHLSKTSRYVRLLCCTSDKAAFNFGSEEIDMLHIDSNHSEKVSCGEVAMWLPKVRPGGFVWFDDIDWPTTQRALAMMDKQCERVKDLVTKDGACRLYVKS